MANSFYCRYGWPTIIGTLLLLPLILYGAVQSMRETSHDVRQWLPDDFVEIETYDWFVEQFGRDEIAVISWPGCTLDDERVERLATALTKSTLTDAASRQHFVFERIVTGPEALGQLTSPKIGLSRSSAMRRLAGNLIGPDGKTTGLLLSVSEFGSKNRGRAVDLIYRVAKSVCGLEADDVRLGGPTVDAVANYRESRRMLYGLAGLSVTLVFLITWIRLRRLSLAVPLLVTSLLSTSISLAALHFLGGQMNLTMTTLPTLVFVLTTSAALHLTYYYRRALCETDVASAPGWAIARGWQPCVLATFTTGIGLASLGISRILPVREFGLFSALGMAVSVVVLLLFLPSLWACWPCRIEEAGSEIKNRRPQQRATWQRKMASLVLRYRIAIVSCLIISAVSAGVGIFELQSSVKIQSRFSSHSRIIRDYRWLEEKLCPLVPMEIVIRFDIASDVRTIERLELVRHVEQAVSQIEGVGATVSAATFGPPIPSGTGAREFAKRSRINGQLTRDKQSFRDAGYVADTQQGELWRITARVRALNDTDYGIFLDKVRQRVESLPAINAMKNVSVEYTGAIPLLYKCLRLLLDDLVRSFLLAFVSITLVMICVLKGLRIGLLVMIPNIFPVLLVFGCMGWMGVAIESGIVKTASIALGIAVDDTFHFLAWYRRGLSENKSREEATAIAFERSAAAMVSTTLVCSVGLSVFMLSSFMPIVRFAVLMISLLVVALIGDLLLLPALLAIFGLPKTASESQQELEVPAAHN